MIAIIDYGMGNLLSVQKALASLGAEAAVVRTPEEVEQAEALILPGVEGLGLIGGTVKRLPGKKVPQIGWNCLEEMKQSPLFTGLDGKPYFYFVHSYYAAPADPGVVAAKADYQLKFPAAFWRDKLFALQFHPEKSSKKGLMILNNFWKLVQKCS